MHSEQNGAVTTIWEEESNRSWEQWILHMSDNHFDSLYCNRDLMIEHLETAAERHARVNIYGDFFDAMQGRYDPRRAYSELRPEYLRDDYYDFVIRDGGEFLLPYAEFIDLIGDGNHELGVLKAANTNMSDRLVGYINEKARDLGRVSHVLHGGYGGWVRWMLQRHEVPLCSLKIKYYHGSGGEAPVTRGAIQTNRQAVYLPDAQIVVNGHSHNAYWIPISRERLSNKGRQYMDVQHHIRTPGYKQAYADGTGGWEVTRGGVPKPIGAIWTRLRLTDLGVAIDIMPDVRAAEIVQPVLENLYDGPVYDED